MYRKHARPMPGHSRPRCETPASPSQTESSLNCRSETVVAVHMCVSTRARIAKGITIAEFKSGTDLFSEPHKMPHLFHVVWDVVIVLQLPKPLGLGQRPVPLPRPAVSLFVISWPISGAAGTLTIPSSASLVRTTGG